MTKNDALHLLSMSKVLVVFKKKFFPLYLPFKASRKAPQTPLKKLDMLCLLKNQCVAMGVSYPVHIVYSIYDLTSRVQMHCGLAQPRPLHACALRKIYLYNRDIVE